VPSSSPILHLHHDHDDRPARTGNAPLSGLRQPRLSRGMAGGGATQRSAQGGISSEGQMEVSQRQRHRHPLSDGGRGCGHGRRWWRRCESLEMDGCVCLEGSRRGRASASSRDPGGDGWAVVLW
jgi:hypothetical protein